MRGQLSIFDKACLSATPCAAECQSKRGNCANCEACGRIARRQSASRYILYEYCAEWLLARDIHHGTPRIGDCIRLCFCLGSCQMEDITSFVDDSLASLPDVYCVGVVCSKPRGCDAGASVQEALG